MCSQQTVFEMEKNAVQANYISPNEIRIVFVIVAKKNINFEMNWTN